MSDKQLIIFDGVCNFCNAWVNFIIPRDPKGKFAFSPRQTTYAENLLQQHQINDPEMSTVILIKNDRVFTASNAALEIAKDLSGLWPLLVIFKIIPTAVRDYFYRLVARNRYRWFGKSAECIMPKESFKSRFIGL
ncbi:MAG: thiol-disulfide oxidoreductase DCC family protein [Porticoccaceae bacterium]